MTYSTFLYDKSDFDYLEIPEETKTIINWIGAKKKVLEAGCHTGFLSYWLKKNNCQVFGIEINRQALEKAKDNLDKSINGDIELDETWDELKDEQFEIVTFIHVLEHLKSPEAALKRGVDRLEKDGTLIIGLPNISNAKNRLEIFTGRFEYTDIGVMDRTHLRFFNQKTARELIEGAGLEVVDYYSPWQVNPIRVFVDHLPFFWRFTRFIKPNQPPKLLNFDKNLTDVVMLFKCRRKVIN